MRQRRRRKRRLGMRARSGRRRGRTRDDETATMRQSAALCRCLGHRVVGQPSENEPAPLVDCFSGDRVRKKFVEKVKSVEMGHNRCKPMGGTAALSPQRTTKTKSNARQLSADQSAQRATTTTTTLRYARTNFTTLIQLAFTATLGLSCCCHLDPYPSTRTSDATNSWQVYGQVLNGPHRQDETFAYTQTIVIKTPQGQLFRGAMRPGDAWNDRDVAEFLGVRYASAPVKRLRFMPPTPFTYAKGSLHDLTRPGSICMQRVPLDVTRAQRELIGKYLAGDSPTANETTTATTIDQRLELMRRSLLASSSESNRLVRSKLGQFTQSEDCLNLNIYTPTEALNRRRVASNGANGGESNSEKDTREGQQSDADDQQPQAQPRQSRASKRLDNAQLRPVLVLVHGHSFDFGSGSLLNAREFARDNRLIVITLNYRLNILGFPPKFGAASRANLGLLDQVAALDWIRANIRSFGGAPENVTLMGYKRGAIFVHLLMLSPLAKGLFQRAILEDGTALSPIVANNLLAANSQQQQQQVALTHLRALAHLCGCPLAPSPASPAPGPVVGNSSTFIPTFDRPQNGGELDQRGTTNSLVFECLRSKPSELLVQHIPSDLIDLSCLAQTPGSGDQQQALPVTSRWRAPLERLFELLSKEELKKRLEMATAAPAANESTSGSDESAMTTTTGVNQQQLDEFKRLFESSPSPGAASMLAIKPEQLNRLAALLVVKLGEYRTERRLSEPIIDVLSAIYLPSNETLPIGPVFAPQLEAGTLVGTTPAAALAHDQLPESDQLANAMLQRNSPFGQRDLMIGLSTPLVDFSTTQEQHAALSSIQNHDHLGSQWPGDLPLVGRPHVRGLTDEQAIAQVNLFVRSFYRFHQQEISNSIVNQYLNSNHNKNELAAGEPVNVDSNEVEQTRVLARRKQLFLHRSLQELYEHALVRVPMLKAVLMHSLRQLESLADLFVTQQLDRMRAIMDEAGGHGADLLWDGPQAAALNRLLEPRQLQENFYTFVKSFYRASSVWPIRLQPPVNASTSSGGGGDGDGSDLLEIERPRSTYLYQFASSSPSALKTKLSHRLQFVLTQLERHAIARARQRPAVQELRAVLMKLIEEINNAQQVAADDAFEFNFGCSLGESGDGTEAGLLRRLNVWICRERIGRRLANFVRTGNANEALASGEGEPTHQDNKELELRLERYQSECLGNQLERDRNQDHLVQLTSESASSSDKTSAAYEILVEQGQQRDGLETHSCRTKIRSLAFEFLMSFTFLQEPGRPLQDWRVFNVFGQQLANFDLAATSSPSDNPNKNSDDFTLESFVSSPSSQREQFDSKVAFWANFIPALNCSRTQPIGTQSLSLFSQANSTLLNMNLNFNCQQQQQQQSNGLHLSATKTANSQLQSMLARVRLELTEQMRARQRFLLGARNQLASSGSSASSISQNHHSPRMANMSTGQQQQQVAGQLEEMVADSTHATTTTTSNNNNSSHNYLQQNWFTAVGGSVSGTSSPASLARRAFVFISRQSASVAFWLLSAVFLLIILIVLVSGLAVARQWKSVRARLRKRRSDEHPKGGNNTSGDTSEHSPGSLQLDASFLQELENQPGQQLMRDQTSSLDKIVGDNNFCQQQRGSSTSFMTTPPLVVHQQQVTGDQILLPPTTLTNGVMDQSPGGDGSEYQIRLRQHHLPTCNLMTMNNENHQQHQQTGGGGLLTSSTSSETINGRAHSSVSLVSTSGTLTGNANLNAGATTRGSVASVATIKKRVKISDPKRRPRSPTLNGGQFVQATPLDLMYANSALYCPIHRASSTNLNFVATEPDLQQQANCSNVNFRDGQMTRSVSSYYGPTQQPQSDQYRGVCPAHENYDHQQHQQQQQQQQLMLMGQLYLASASKTNSLQRK